MRSPNNNLKVCMLVDDYEDILSMICIGVLIDCGMFRCGNED